MSDEFQSYCASQGIQWNFITEYAPWQGGVYERMVGVTKSALRKAIGRKFLNRDQLQTLLCEAEAVVNSRPLTYVSEDIGSSAVLRPIDFLIPEGQIGTPHLDLDNDDPDYVPRLDSKGKLLKYWASTQECLQRFWRLFHDEYLPSLRERFDSAHRKHKSSRPYTPQEGDVVQVQSEGTSRSEWKLGRIFQIIQGRDEKIRSAEVKMPNGKVLTRPINFLHPLEVVDSRIDTSATMEIKTVELPSGPEPRNKEALDQRSNEPVSSRTRSATRTRLNVLAFACAFMFATSILPLVTASSTVHSVCHPSAYVAPPGYYSLIQRDRCGENDTRVHILRDPYNKLCSQAMRCHEWISPNGMVTRGVVTSTQGTKPNSMEPRHTTPMFGKQPKLKER